MFGFGRFRGNCNLITHLVAVSLEVRVDGHHHKVVLRLPEHAALLLRHSNYFVRHPTYFDGLANRVLAAKEALVHIVADESKRRMSANFLLAKLAANANFYIPERWNISSNPLQTHRLHGLTRVRDGYILVRFQTNIAQQLRMTFNEFVLLWLDLRVTALHFKKLLRIPIADESDTHYTESVRTHVREFCRNVKVHAMHE